MAKFKLKKNGTLVTEIYDEEGDPIKCSFNYDGCVEIKTKEYSYLCLSKENLIDLIQLIDKAEKKYDKMNNQPNEL